MPSYRLLTLMMLLVALVIAGCGGDDGGDDGDDGGSSPVAITDESPANVVPADAPIVISFTTDLDSEQAQSALAFAERVEPSDRDLEAELRKELESDDVSYEKDVKPWIGDSGIVALDNFTGDDAAGVFAVRTSDEAAAQAALDKGMDKGTEATYKGVKYKVDNDGSANGIVDGFVVGASDEAHFKAAVDASQGSSLADDSKYQETLGLASDDALGTGYFDVDGLIELANASGQVPPGTFDQLEQIPGFEPGMTGVVALEAEDDQVTLETVSSGPAPEGSDGGPDIADLAGDAWVALAAPVDGKQFLEGFNQGIAASGVAGADQILESVGLPKFLEGLESLSMRFGGESVETINGELTIGGSDEAAAKDLITKLSPFAQQAASSNGVQLQQEDNGLSASFGPYNVTLTSDGGDVKLRVGDEPSGKLSDSEGFKRAEDEIDIDGGRIIAFVDFAPLQKFVQSLPQDEDLAEAMPVLEQLGVLAVGSGEEDGHATGKAVLTLR